MACWVFHGAYSEAGNGELGNGYVLAVFYLVLPMYYFYIIIYALYFYKSVSFCFLVLQQIHLTTGKNNVFIASYLSHLLRGWSKMVLAGLKLVSRWSQAGCWSTSCQKPSLTPASSHLPAPLTATPRDDAGMDILGKFHTLNTFRLCNESTSVETQQHQGRKLTFNNRH